MRSSQAELRPVCCQRSRNGSRLQESLIWCDSAGSDIRSLGDFGSLPPHGLPPQHLHDAHEIIVGFEADDDLSLVLAPNLDFDMGGQTLPDVILHAFYVAGAFVDGVLVARHFFALGSY